jgi:hypothetical protein
VARPPIPTSLSPQAINMKPSVHQKEQNNTMKRRIVACALLLLLPIRICWGNPDGAPVCPADVAAVSDAHLINVQATGSLAEGGIVVAVGGVPLEEGGPPVDLEINRTYSVSITRIFRRTFFRGMLWRVAGGDSGSNTEDAVSVLDAGILQVSTPCTSTGVSQGQRPGSSLLTMAI